MVHFPNIKDANDKALNLMAEDKCNPHNIIGMYVSFSKNLRLNQAWLIKHHASTRVKQHPAAWVHHSFKIHSISFRYILRHEKAYFTFLSFKAVCIREILSISSFGFQWCLYHWYNKKGNCSRSTGEKYWTFTSPVT